MRLVNIDKLTNDMSLAKPIYQADGEKVLLNTGCCNLMHYKERLASMGIHYIYIEDELSKGIEITDVIKEQTRTQGKKIVADVVQNITNKRSLDIDKVKKGVMDMINDIMNNKSILLNLTDIRTNDSYTFSHSVNVTVIAILIGKAIHYDESKLMKLGMGAILHDIGKAIIPDEILNKPGKLTNEEFKIMQEHSQLGFDLIKGSWELSPLSKTIILSHHEKWDGTGYPRGLKGDEIHEFARIVSICDVFDALASDRCYRPKWPMYQVIEYLTSYAGSQFDSHLITKFIQHVATFPNGALVTLSDGRMAIVQEQNDGFPTRPIIKIYAEKDGQLSKDNCVVDLMKELSIVIIDSE